MRLIEVEHSPVVDGVDRLLRVVDPDGVVSEQLVEIVALAHRHQIDAQRVAGDGTQRRVREERPRRLRSGGSGKSNERAGDRARARCSPHEALAGKQGFWGQYL